MSTSSSTSSTRSVSPTNTKRSPGYENSRTYFLGTKEPGSREHSPIRTPLVEPLVLAMEERRSTARR
jgi:hypothetical protein